MPTAQALKAQISSVEDLQSVVKTMKALAAVSIRQYQRAVESLSEYNRTVEMGLHIAMRRGYFSDEYTPQMLSGQSESGGIGRIGAIVFGSDQGLCGQFNERVVSHGMQQLDEWEVKPENRAIAAVGARIVPLLSARKQAIATSFSVPSSVNGITNMVQEILLNIQQWRNEEQVARIVIFYNQSLSGSSYEPRTLQLLPLNPDWLKELVHKDWPNNVLPTFTMDWNRLFSALIREYLFLSLYRAFAESLASENASRLSSMQAAEKNIQERLGDLTSQYRRERQSSITSELLEVASGFEALTQSEG
ncbi:F0F1 ATP synthase subunit gamma [Phormidium sp. CCY1219]|uniref:F0F1 ATP synthase subunit gamma n=1 Tax=Phormidium sp. CCY1219 TaxID=2886104 RepID=UPI002D1ED5BD|nr:F0F1 ATP synthase subunit gamma [Phormidium sp. CCY1219]MEB3829605.1 F0F1 ATP synthase subunit gamma [Phormidium sp. CCY1219]